MKLVKISVEKKELLQGYGEYEISMSVPDVSVGGYKLKTFLWKDMGPVGMDEGIYN